MNPQPPIDRRSRPERRTTKGRIVIHSLASERDSLDAILEAKPPIRGHAALFNTRTTLYEDSDYIWTEEIAPGAFASAIREDQDVRALFNHDPNYVLGRTRAKTLRLSEDTQGLAFECDVPWDSKTVEDLVLQPMLRGDLDQCSFAFVVRDDGEKIEITRKDGRVHQHRIITDVDLYDVSVVTYPQYPETDAYLAEEARERLRRAIDDGPRPAYTPTAAQRQRLALLQLRFHGAR